MEASYQEDVNPVGVWKLAVDGSSNQIGSEAEIIMTSPKGNVFAYVIRFNKFVASNNKSEYKSAIAGLRMCLTTGTRKINLQIDSQLVASQIKEKYQAREATMQKVFS